MPSRTRKSPTAFRTISEVAEELDVAQHVLRFWETKFRQLKPLKRAGGRRFYRPEDIELLKRIKSLLRDERYTIEGVQRLLNTGKMPVNDGASANGHAAPANDPGTTPPPETRDREAELAAILAELKALRAELKLPKS